MEIEWKQTSTQSLTHAWIVSPLNPDFARSGCGMVYSSKRLLSAQFRRCKQCEKAIRRQQLSEEGQS